jgi:hypothetical protein
MARRLVAGGADSFHRVLIDPRDGAPLEIGRTSYRVTKALRQWLRLRDAKCSFRGCNNASLDNDADHVLAWADGGTTGISNLGQPCRKHHRLKHTTAWTPVGAAKTSPPGWTSPTGRTYPSEHQDWEPPTWPENMRVSADPGRDPVLDLPPDPVPDWYQVADGLPGYEPCDEPETELPPDPGWDSGLDLPPDPERDSGLELPPDPFPGWSEFRADHQLTSAEVGCYGWSGSLVDASREGHLL